MTFSIPVNLMSLSALPPQPSIEATKSDTLEEIQTTRSSTPPVSAVVPTQNAALEIAQEARRDPKTSNGVPNDTNHPAELDRYAPPNPLPTAPILQAAAAYAAARREV